jgi:hypothetical protein
MPKTNRENLPKLPTTAQLHARGAFAKGTFGWDDLTPEEYAAWDEAVKKEKRRRHLPASHRLNAHGLYTRINANQHFLGLPPFRRPPEYPAFDLEQAGPLVAEEGPKGLSLKLRVPRVLTGHILVFGAAPCRAGKRYCDKFCYLGLLPTPDRDVSDLSALYFARFGVPRPGSRVIIVVEQQIDGWRGIPTRLDVVV